LPAADRRVRDPERIVFVPGWNLPIYFFPLQKATLTKESEKIGSAEVRYLSLRAEGEDVFSPPTLAFLCDVPSAGNYRVSIVGLRGPDQGRVELTSEEQPVGKAADLYAPERSKSDVTPMGTLSLKQGANPIFFRLAGKNAKSSGLGLDLVEIALVKE
jgi:hypothetical protein